jgi:rubrerythrin
MLRFETASVKVFLTYCEYSKEVDKMPLENFGSVLNFAEKLEKEDNGFYLGVAQNPDCEQYKEVFSAFAVDAAKNAKTIERTRRENVTEMILETIRDFTREPFLEECPLADTLNASAALEASRRLEDRALRYYTRAAEKMKALPEVSRALKLVGKKRKAHVDKLSIL